MEEKSKNEKSNARQSQLLKDKLFYKTQNALEKLDRAEQEKLTAYGEAYKKFIDEAKTEREAVNTAVAMAEAKGFVPFRFGSDIKPGGKYYYNNRGKSLFLFVAGSECAGEGIRIAAAHIDSPRVDLKQRPLYEDGNMGFFKTHYYGGIKKYQWTAIPLALHGIVTKADGSVVDVRIGESDGDPVFYINDLLPHLAKDQMAKPLGEAIPGESLNILIGSAPYRDDTSGEKPDEAIKLNLMAILNEKYGIVEADFLSAELTAVPAFRARDVGLDRSLIGGYGHDDRVCAYPALTAVIEADAPVHTLMTVLADKEETGSNGNTGMKSAVFKDLVDEIARCSGVSGAQVRAASKCLSADVNAAFDPNFPDVYERKNSAFVNCGVVLTKYTGARGKSGTSDASGEFVGFARSLFDKAGVIWQTAELGKVDQGGGGTVAAYIAEMNIDTVDLGVPVISMHAPYEVISKADLYMTYRAFTEFYK